MANDDDIEVWIESTPTNSSNERETLYTDPSCSNQSFKMLTGEHEKMCSMRVRASAAFCSGNWHWLGILVQVGERDPELYLITNGSELLGLRGVEVQKFELPGAIPGNPFGPDFHIAPVVVNLKLSCRRIADPSNLMFTHFQVVAEEILDYWQRCGIAWFNDAFLFSIDLVFHFQIEPASSSSESLDEGVSELSVSEISVAASRTSERTTTQAEVPQVDPAQQQTTRSEPLSESVESTTALDAVVSETSLAPPRARRRGRTQGRGNAPRIRRETRTQGDVPQADPPDFPFTDLDIMNEVTTDDEYSTVIKIEDSPSPRDSAVEAPDQTQQSGEDAASNSRENGNETQTGGDSSPNEHPVIEEEAPVQTQQSGEEATSDAAENGNETQTDGHPSPNDDPVAKEEVPDHAQESVQQVTSNAGDIGNETRTDGDSRPNDNPAAEEEVPDHVQGSVQQAASDAGDNSNEKQIDGDSSPNDDPVTEEEVSGFETEEQRTQRPNHNTLAASNEEEGNVSSQIA